MRYTNTLEYYKYLSDIGKKCERIAIDDEIFINVIYEKKYIFRRAILYCESEAIEHVNVKRLISRLIRNPLNVQVIIYILSVNEGVADIKRFKDELNYTYLLSLNEFENYDDYFMHLESRLRTKIRKADRQEITIVQAKSEQEIREYATLKNETRTNLGYAPIEEEIFISSWKNMRNTAKWDVYLAKQNGRTLVGQAVIRYQDELVLAGVCTSPAVYSEKLSANEKMQSYIVSMAYDEGIGSIDWVGANPKSKNPKEVSIDKFKAKWNGKLSWRGKYVYESRVLRAIHTLMAKKND